MKHERKPVDDLTTTETDQMYTLMNRYYHGVERSTFQEDLGRKDHAFFLRADDEIVGFSTITEHLISTETENVIGLFSGDTVVEKAHRAGPGLAIELGHYFRVKRKNHDTNDLYWILTTKGCRTYAILPMLFETFSPHYDQETPDRHTRIRNAFADQKYPKRYDPDENLIKHPPGAQRLQPGVGEVTERYQDNPHVQYFSSKNPDHMEGDELVCVARAVPSNYTAWFQRIIKRTKSRASTT